MLPEDRRFRGYRVHWAGVLAVAGQEVAWVTRDSQWLSPVGDVDEFRRLLRLRSHLAKWHGLWLLLAPVETLEWALGEYRETGTRRIDVAVRDAGWVLHSLSWADYADQASLALLDWLEETHPRRVLQRLELLPRFPGNDHGRIDKSIRIIQVAIKAANEGARSMAWGTLTFDLTPLVVAKEA